MTSNVREQFGNKSGFSQQQIPNKQIFSSVYSVQAQESVSVAILLSEASRIALLQLDGNEEALRLYMQSMRSTIFLAEYRAECKIITYPRASIVAQSLTVIRNFARISESQELARINAFHYVCFPPSSPQPGVGSVKPRLCLQRSVRSAIAKVIKFRKSWTIR